MGQIIKMKGVIKGDLRKSFAKQNGEEPTLKTKTKTKADKAKETI